MNWAVNKEEHLQSIFHSGILSPSFAWVIGEDGGRNLAISTLKVELLDFMQHVQSEHF